MTNTDRIHHVLQIADRIHHVLQIARSRISSDDEVCDAGPSDRAEHHAYVVDAATIDRAYDLRASIQSALASEGFGEVAFDAPVPHGEGRANFRFHAFVGDPISTLQIAGHRISAHRDLFRAAGWDVYADGTVHRHTHDGDAAARRLLRVVHEQGASTDPTIEGGKATMVLHRTIELGEVEAEHERRERARFEVARLERASAADQLSATKLQARAFD